MEMMVGLPVEELLPISGGIFKFMLVELVFWLPSNMGSKGCA